MRVARAASEDLYGLAERVGGCTGFTCCVVDLCAKRILLRAFGLSACLSRLDCGNMLLVGGEDGEIDLSQPSYHVGGMRSHCFVL